MPELPDDYCPRPAAAPAMPTTPFATPIYLASVYACDSPDQADALLGGQLEGYVYQRDRHPNADLLAETCRRLHQADRALLASSGMAALATAFLAHCRPGDHLVLGHVLYGGSRMLLASEAARWGVDCAEVDACDADAFARACTPRTRLALVETISNPLTRVVDVARLADIARRGGARLLVDNTFATPLLCQPLTLGADLVMESVTKMMNGHGDVVLGLLGGRADAWERVPRVNATWGFASSPFDCWLAARGLATLPLRMERACATALRAAEFLLTRPEVARVDYPGLTNHPDHALAARQFAGRFGSMLSFHLRGGRAAADAFIAAKALPFCPSLGESATTVSHPESTSHRGLTSARRAELGISGGTLRLSVGLESSEHVLAALARGLAAPKK